MSNLFLKIVNMSISASWLVLAVLMLRVVLRKAPKWVHVLLWGIVAVRLICPFSIESALSLIPSAETISPNIMMDSEPAIHSGIPAINQVVNPVISDSFAPALGDSANPFQIWIPVLAAVWLIGVAVLLIYTAVSYCRLRWKVSEAVMLRDNIYQSEHVGAPFVLGIVKPKIYLPYRMNGQDMEYVVAHEQAHIRRRDHWWKPLGFLLLTIHWFNPLMWIAYVLLCRDIELACDEKVIKEMGNEQRADYTQALVDCSVDRRMIAACPLAFGEVGVKERVKSVMNYKKPALWMIVVSIAACVVVAICFLTSPITISDHFVLTDSSSPANTKKLTYDIQLGNQAMSGEIYVEQWVDGTCVKSAPVVMTQYVDSIEITMRDRRENGSSVGTDIQIETNQYGGSLLTYFAHPENLNVVGWGFKGYELGEEKELTPNKGVILAAKVFDGGNGIRAFDCETLENEPERLETAACTIVVRAVFSTDSLGVTNQGEATLPVEVLTLNDVIVLSRKGKDLTWSDFQQYDYIETGSGLYIRVYEINEMFKLWIGGSGVDADPMYIYLSLTDDPDTRIDIRDGAVEAFITKDHSEALLNRAINDAILRCNWSEQTAGLYHCASFVMLDKEETSGTPVVGSTDHTGCITVYGVALYQEYDLVDEKLREEISSHTPVAITFDVHNGRYSLKEYWRPHGDSSYASDIRDKFPDAIENDAMDTQKYFAAQRRECQERAMRDNGYDVFDSD